MKIDLHVHCAERSACAVSRADEQVGAAVAAGLDGLAFTDHNRLLPAEALASLNARWAPFRIFSGIEVSTDSGDCLVFGLSDPSLEVKGWSYARLHALVRERGGFLAIAHPYRWSTEITADIAALPPDALEIASNNVSPDLRPRIRETAASVSACLLSDSDAHSVERLGSYWNDFPSSPRDDAELLRELLSRRFSPIFPQA